VATIRELVTKWTLDTKQSEAAIARFDNGISSVKTSLTIIGAAGAAAAATLFGIAQSVANMGDKARKTAQSIGLTTESLQELAFAGKIGGVGQEEMTASMGKLARTASEASRGVETYKRSYNELGISVKDSSGNLKSTDQIFMEVSDQFQKMENGTKKTALAMDLFGRSGMKLIPMLNGGSKAIANLRAEALASGAVISDADAMAGEEFNDTIARLKMQFDGIKVAIGNDLIPTMTDLMKSFIEWIKINKEVLKSNLRTFLKFLATSAKTAYKVFYDLGRSVGFVINLFGGLEKVLKVVGIAFGILMGVRLLFGIGQIVQGVTQMSTVFKLLSRAIGVANIQAAIIPTLIGVGFVMVALILEDVISYFQGKDSVTAKISEFIIELTKSGGVIGFIANMVDSLGKVIGGLTAMLVGLFTLNWDLFLEPLKSAWEWLKNISDIAGGFLSKIGRFLGAGDMSASNIPLDKAGTAINTVTSMSPRSSPVPASMGGPASGIAQSNISLNAPVTVNVPAGTPPDQVGDAVQRGISDALGRTFRQASRSTEPQEAY